MTDIQTPDDRPEAVVHAEEAAAGSAAVEPALIDANLARSFPEYTRAWLARLRSGETGLLPVLVGVVVLVIIFQIENSKFLTALNLTNLLQQAGFLVLFGIAEVFVLLLGEIDLSAAFVGAVGAAFTCVESTQHGWGWFPSIVLGLLVCAVIGFLQGFLKTWLKLPSFIVTLAGFLFWEGFLLWFINNYGGKDNGGSVNVTNPVLNDLNNGNISPLWSVIVVVVVVVLYAVATVTRDMRRKAAGLESPPPAVSAIKIVLAAAAGVCLLLICNSNRSIGLLKTTGQSGIPWVVLIMAGIAALWSFLLGRTRFGRYVYAIGGNAEAARRAGVAVDRIRILCFVLCSVTAGMAGIIYASNLGSISTSFNGGQYVLYAVAAAVIGGTSLFGGRGKIIHAVLGGLVIATIANGMSLLSLGAAAQEMITALVLLAAVVIDAIARRGAQAT
ncbi:sugar ABC transporter permease [Rudaeicoccus suwonensis]|uniref:D-xylose transport system permease protein n=1 Tax=Rudaeicoccus suwonensis TaxID=657409 RepID=A0A561EAJ0_9MICO|nr:ABC transporter permease [Rudaeicoccus suwonensis]TWE12607.1 D-xylose transport system permease protein [Rudaeicoccus suwonensis]